MPTVYCYNFQNGTIQKKTEKEKVNKDLQRHFDEEDTQMSTETWTDGQHHQYRNTTGAYASVVLSDLTEVKGKQRQHPAASGETVWITPAELLKQPLEKAFRGFTENLAFNR